MTGVGVPVTGRRRFPRPPALRLYLPLVAVAVATVPAAGAAVSPAVRADIVLAAPWILALFAAEMVPWPLWRDIRISLGFPLVVFLAVLHHPAAVGAVVLVGAGDPRELTGDSDLSRSIFNRAQVAASGMAGSAVFHAIGPGEGFGPLALLGVAAAALAHLATNVTLVGVAARLDYRVPIGQVVRGLLIGERWGLQGAYAAIGAFGGAAALVFREVGVWALVGLVLPLAALRYLFQVARAMEREGERARREESQRRAAAERDREREELAAALHDDVSPRLVALGYQLDRARRSSGANADAALQAARDATRTSQERVRAMIGHLLRQPTASEASGAVIERIVDEAAGDVEVVRYLDPTVTEGPEAELLLGVAREALRNAVRHGRAARVDIVLRRKGAGAVLIVSDDGEGFDPEEVAHLEGHYGLRLLRRRIESAGGVFSLVSAPGHGTVLTCEVPLRARGETSDEAASGLSRDLGR